MDDFRSCAASLGVRNAVRDDLVVKSAEASKNLVWPEVSPKEFFAKPTSAYRRPDPNTVAGLVFHEASSKIVTAAVGHLLILDALAGELSGFFGALKVNSDVEVFIVGDVE